MTSMIEHCAKAIYHATPRNKPYEQLSKFQRQGCLLMARAAIESMQEPSDNMCAAMVEVVERSQSGKGAPFPWPDIEHMWDVHYASIDAALKEQP